MHPSSKKIADWLVTSTSITLPLGTACPQPTAVSAALTELSSDRIWDATDSRRADVPPSRNFVVSDT